MKPKKWLTPKQRIERTKKERAKSYFIVYQGGKIDTSFRPFGSLEAAQKAVKKRIKSIKIKERKK